MDRPRRLTATIPFPEFLEVCPYRLTATFLSLVDLYLREYPLLDHLLLGHRILCLDLVRRISASWGTSPH